MALSERYIPKGELPQSVRQDVILPWLHPSESKKVELQLLSSSGKLVQFGYVTDSYKGDGGVTDDEKAQGRLAFERTARTVADSSFGIRTDDCLSGAGKDAPPVLVQLLGRNANKNALFIYILDTRIKGVRSLLLVGTSRGEKRRRFEKPLQDAGYRSNRGTKNGKAYK